MGNTVDKKTISADLARQLIDAAVAKAKKMGVPQTIAVLDDSGQLKAFCRMDGAPLVGIEIAQNKAYTALVGMPTHEFYEFISKDPSLLTGVPHVRRIAAFGGGFPITIDGMLAGSIGISGGTGEQDMACARAALETIAS